MFRIFEQKIEKELKSFLQSSETQAVVKATQEDKAYIVRFKITNESQDRDGEIIKAGGIDWSHFDKNPVILIDHNYKVWSIAGKAVKREIVWNETYLDVQLAKGVEAGELVKTLHEQGMIKGVSIGFIPTERDAKNNRIITKSEALEASFVAIGSNREALIEDAKLYEKCVKTGFIEETQEKELTISDVSAGDIIAYRNVWKYTNAEWEEIERVYPVASESPYVAKVVEKYENDEQILSWSDEVLIATSENPILLTHGYVRSKAGPIMLNMNVWLKESQSMRIESVIEEKAIEEGEVKFTDSSVETQDIDKKEILDSIKSVGDSVKTLESQLKTFADDKVKGEKLEKARKAGQNLACVLSDALKELK